MSNARAGGQQRKMATGDIKGAVASLQRALKHIRYPGAVDEVG
jgi:hypothetical protein